MGTITSGCLLPFDGKLLDRLGARRVVVLAAVRLGITLAYLALCDRIVTILSGIEGIFVAFGFAIAPCAFSQAIALLGWQG